MITWTDAFKFHAAQMVLGLALCLPFVIAGLVLLWIGRKRGR